MRLILLGLLISLTVTGLPLTGHTADTPAVPPIPASMLADDAPFIVSPDGPALVRLPADAASVVVGNPIHATAVIENSRLIMLIPGQPGATSITVLDTDGQVILNRKVHVGAGNAKTGTLRIKNVCAGPNMPNECRASITYSCTDRCFETTPAPLNADGSLDIPTPPPPVPQAATAETNDPAPLPTPEAPAPDTVDDAQ